MIETGDRLFDVSKLAISNISDAISFQAGLYLISMLFLLSGCLSDGEIDTPALPAGTTNISNTSASSFSPAIASVGQTVYIVWTDTANGVQDIYLVRSGDGGQSFSARVNVSESVDDASVNPQIAVSGTSVYVVWEEFLLDRDESDIFFRKIEDNSGKLTISSRKNLSLSQPVCMSNTKGNDSCPSQFPAIAAIDSEVLIAWAEWTDYILFESEKGKEFRPNNADILLVGSSNRGDSFTLFPASPVILSKQNPTFSLNPTLAVAQGTFHIAWSDFIPPNKDLEDAKIVYRSFNGTIFDPPIASIERVLSGSIRGSGNPSLAASGGNTYLVWVGSPPVTESCPTSSDIFFIKSTDGFSTVLSDDPINISNNVCRSFNGKISVSGDTVYIVWEDNSPGLSGILFQMSMNGGTSFSETTKLTDISGSVSSPAISAAASDLYAAWEGAFLGNLEIFFKLEK